MNLIDLASAHLQTVQARIGELSEQKVQIESEITRLTNILEEGSKLIKAETPTE